MPRGVNYVCFLHACVRVRMCTKRNVNIIHFFQLEMQVLVITTGVSNSGGKGFTAVSSVIRVRIPTTEKFTCKTLASETEDRSR